MFTIGAFSRLAGVSPKALRAYDELGLFRPVWVDPSSRYRFYSPAQLPEIRRIAALRDMGLPLAEIAGLASEGADLATVLRARRRDLERTRREIDRRLAALDIRVAMTDGERAGGAGPQTAHDAFLHAAIDVVVRPLRAELVALMDVPGGDIEAAFYELEAHVRDTGQRASRPPGAIEVDGSSGRPGLTTIYVPLSRSIPSTDRIRIERLPEVRVATILVRGSYDALRPARTTLDRWIAAAGFEPDGPLRIVYLQFGAEAELRVPSGYTVDRAAEFVTELQQPVR